MVSAILIFAAAVGAHGGGEHKAMDIVKAELKDPDTAKFKGLKVDKDGHGCGWVNAKNSYGGYTGYSVFFIGKGDKVVILAPDLSDPKLCE